MRKISIAAWMGLVTGLAVGLTACSGKTEAPKKEKNLFEAAVLTQATQLTIAKDDAADSDAWVARLEKRADGWHLQSGPHGEKLTDTLADSRWVNHFIDTLRTLQSAGTAPPSTQASYGLHRPLYRVEWSGAGQGDSIRFGSEDAPGGTVFGQKGADVNSPIFLVYGSAIRMLGQLDTFVKIRERRLLNFELDDIDEVIVEWGGGKKQPAQQRYFQRQGEFWADLQNVRYRGQGHEQIINAFEAVAHLQIARFPDLLPITAGSVQAAPSRGMRGPDGQVTLRMRTRTGEDYRLEMVQTQGQGFAQLSTRPGNRFSLYPQAGLWMAKLRALPARADVGERPVKTRR